TGRAMWRPTPCPDARFRAAHCRAAACSDQTLLPLCAVCARQEAVTAGTLRLLNRILTTALIPRALRRVPANAARPRRAWRGAQSARRVVQSALHAADRGACDCPAQDSRFFPVQDA